MKSLKILFLCLCFVLPSTIYVDGKTNGENEFFVIETSVQNDFPNIFRPITNIFKKIFGIKRREIIEYRADVTNLTLSRNEVIASCAANQDVCSGSKSISVYTEVSNPANDVITYEYKVSGGKIIGKGEKVVWDLSGEKFGTYTITAGVDDGCGFCGYTKTKQVTVVECADCIQLNDKLLTIENHNLDAGNNARHD